MTIRPALPFCFVLFRFLFLMRMLLIWTQVSGFAQEIFYRLSHLPGPETSHPESNPQKQICTVFCLVLESQLHAVPIFTPAFVLMRNFSVFCKATSVGQTQGSCHQAQNIWLRSGLVQKSPNTKIKMDFGIGVCPPVLYPEGLKWWHPSTKCHQCLSAPASPYTHVPLWVSFLV